MKSLLRIFLFVILTLSATSCFTIMAISRSQRVAREQGKYFGDEKARMDLKTFQRISGYSALAMTGSGDVVCIIAKMDEYYDGMTISGRWLKMGTYSYTSSSGARRTVLVYLLEDDKDDLESYVEDFLKNNPDAIVDVHAGASI